MRRSIHHRKSVVVRLVLLAAAALAVLLPVRSQATTTSPSFGAQFHGMWSSWTDAQRATALDQLVAGGAQWVRIDVSWAMVQPTSRDAYDMTWGVPFVDRVIGMASSRGLKVLVTFWLTPGWANGNAGERALPTDPNDYANAARWMAHRYAGQVQAWEVWNEPNDPGFMVGADPVQYTHLLQASYSAFHDGDAATTVVFGGTQFNDDAWIAAAYAGGAHGFFDVMATHPYMAVADLPPDTPNDGSKYRLMHIPAVEAVMQANGDGDKPIWWTEVGWSTHSNDGIDMTSGATNWVHGVTPDQAADYLVRTLKLAATQFPYVSNVFWYTERDMPLPAPYTLGQLQNDNYGLLDVNLSPKPAWYAARDYLRSTAAPPAAPANLAVTAMPASAAVSWNAVADPSVVAYRVYRDGAAVTSTTATSWSDTALVASTSYNYSVTAVGAAGLESLPSATVTLTTPAPPDTTTPTVPSGLGARAVSSAQVDLRWTAASDNVGVTAYRIYRGGALVATSTQTSFSDTGVAPFSTYSYSISAVDAAGNVSSPAPSVSVNTPAASGTVFTLAPSDDVYVAKGQPKANYGTKTSLSVSGSPVSDTLLKFTVDTHGCALGSATLRLTTTSDGSVQGGLVAPAGSGWSQSTVTWSTAPAATGPVVASFGKVATKTTYSTNVLPVVTSDGDVTFRITSTSSDSVGWLSKEGSATAGPRLVVRCA